MAGPAQSTSDSLTISKSPTNDPDKPTGASDSNGAEANKTASSNAVVSTSDEHGDAELARVSTESPLGDTNEANATQEADSNNMGKGEKPKKGPRRPKWPWAGRRRNESKSKGTASDKGENKAVEARDTSAQASTKEPAVVVDERKDITDLSPVRVALLPEV